MMMNLLYHDTLNSTSHVVPNISILRLPLSMWGNSNIITRTAEDGHLMNITNEVESRLTREAPYGAPINCSST